MAAPTLSPPPLTTPLAVSDGTPTPTWARWLQQLQTALTTLTTASLVSAIYHATIAANTTSGGYTVLNADTMDLDTDDSVTTGAAWKYTCQPGNDGLHLITAIAHITNTTVGASSFAMSAFKNGTEISRLGGEQNITAARVYGTGGSYVVDLAEGDTLNARVFQNTGSNQALYLGTTATCTITITRLGP